MNFCAVVAGELQGQLQCRCLGLAAICVRFITFELFGLRWKLSA